MDRSDRRLIAGTCLALLAIAVVVVALSSWPAKWAPRSARLPAGIQPGPPAPPAPAGPPPARTAALLRQPGRTGVSYSTGADIPDGDPDGIVISYGRPPACGRLTDTEIRVFIRHPRPSDLEASVINPDGTRVVLHHQGDASDVRAAVYDSRGVAARGLAALHGKPAFGRWQLWVRDLVPGTAGRFLTWRQTTGHAP